MRATTNPMKESCLQANAVAPIGMLKCTVPHREVAFSDWIAVFAPSFNSLLLLWSNGISYTGENREECNSFLNIIVTWQSVHVG